MMPFDEENKDTWPGLRGPGTLPRIPEWTPPPAPRRRRAGTAVLVTVLAVVAGVALASTFIPGFRHAVHHEVSKVLRHQQTVKSPVLRDGSRAPARRTQPAGVVVSITPRTSQSAVHMVSPSRTPMPVSAPASVGTHPAARPSPARTRAAPTRAPSTRAPATTSPTSTPPAPSSTPTPTQDPTATTPPPTPAPSIS